MVTDALLAQGMGIQSARAFGRVVGKDRFEAVDFLELRAVGGPDGAAAELDGDRLQAFVHALSELVAVGAPGPWEDIAASLWSEVSDRNQLRRRWDVLLFRLRQRLREGGVRPDLLRSSRVGLVELVLLPGDVVEDHT